MYAKTIVLAAVAAGFAATFAATGASASTPAVYARHGVIYLQDGTRLTEDEVNAQPRLSPDGTRIAYLHNNTVWVMGARGAGKHQVSDRTGSAPAWSAAGDSITYTAESCTGAPGTFRVGTEGGQASEVVLPESCRDQALPAVGYING
jgi:TolB protein